MTDDKGRTGNPDRQRIGLSEDHEVRDRAQQFGVNDTAFRTLVAPVVRTPLTSAVSSKTAYMWRLPSDRPDRFV